MRIRERADPIGQCRCNSASNFIGVERPARCNRLQSPRRVRGELARVQVAERAVWPAELVESADIKDCARAIACDSAR